MESKNAVTMMKLMVAGLILAPSLAMAEGGIWSRLQEKFGLEPANTPSVSAPSAAPTTAAPAEKQPAPEIVQALADALVKHGRAVLNCSCDDPNMVPFSIDLDGKSASGSCSDIGGGPNMDTTYREVLFTQADLGDKFLLHEVDGTPYLLFKSLVPQTVGTLADLKDAIVTDKDLEAAVPEAEKVFAAQDAARAKSDLSDIQKDAQEK
jgi:hypothetical protein